MEEDKNNDTIKKKRKYTKKPKVGQRLTNDGKVIKTEAKKRGRKKGRMKKKDLTMKPEEVLDYMIRNYPGMKIECIKDKVVNGLKLKNRLYNEPYVLDKFKLNGKNYYYDDYGSVIDSDATLVGYFLDKEDGTKQLYMLNDITEEDELFNDIYKKINNE